MIRFRCEHCRAWLTIAETRAGETGKCPLCRQATHIPPVSETPPPAEAGSSDPAQRLSSPPAPGDVPLELVRDSSEPDQHASQKVAFYCEIQGPPQATSESAIPQVQKAASPSRARLLDVLLYPMNLDGLARIAVFALGLGALHWLIVLLHPWMDDRIERGTLVLGFFWIFVASYAVQYFGYCILDSAKGGTRAPPITPSYIPPIGDEYSRLLLAAGAVALCFGPAALYRLLATTIDWRFWGLASLGAFCLPMTLLAGTLVGGTESLNPVPIVRSIAATLPAYLGLILRLTLLLSPAATIHWVSWRQGVPLVFSYAAYLYSLWIAGHLLGRFYLRRKDKLGWEV